VSSVAKILGILVQIFVILPSEIAYCSLIVFRVGSMLKFLYSVIHVVILDCLRFFVFSKIRNIIRIFRKIIFRFFIPLRKFVFRLTLLIGFHFSFSVFHSSFCVLLLLFSIVCCNFFVVAVDVHANSLSNRYTSPADRPSYLR
jgi:hypothetical protein